MLQWWHKTQIKRDLHKTQFLSLPNETVFIQHFLTNTAENSSERTYSMYWIYFCWLDTKSNENSHKRIPNFWAHAFEVFIASPFSSMAFEVFYCITLYFDSILSLSSSFLLLTFSRSASIWMFIVNYPSEFISLKRGQNVQS